MAKTVRVEVKGLQQLGERMMGLKEDMQKRIARSASAAGAVVIKKSAIQKAPVLTGNLKKNIIVKRIPPAETNLTSQHIVTVRQGKLTEKQKKAGLQDAFYGRFVEYGTVNAPAQPYLRPAFDQDKEKAVEAMRDRIESRLNKAGV